MSRVIDASVLAYPSGSPSKVAVQIEIPDELQVLEGTEQPQPGCGCFRILSAKDGDKRVTWMNDSLESINAAKKLFIDLVKQGLTPYRVGRDGRKTSDVMVEFDPAAEEVIFIPTRLVTGG